MATRSSGVNQAESLLALNATATTTRSNTWSDRRTISTCPLVMGSNEPGYTATFMRDRRYTRAVRSEATDTSTNGDASGQREFRDARAAGVELQLGPGRPVLAPDERES